MPIPNYKDIVDLLKTGFTIEAQVKIMELREATMELQEENIVLREKVAALEAQLKRGKDLKFDGKVYRLEGDSTPFCAVCYDNKAKLIHLKSQDSIHGGTILGCPVCYGSLGAMVG